MTNPKKIKLIRALILTFLVAALITMSACSADPEEKKYDIDGFLIGVRHIGDEESKEYEAHIMGYERPEEEREDEGFFAFFTNLGKDKKAETEEATTESVQNEQVEPKIISIPASLTFKLNEKKDEQDGKYNVVSVSGLESTDILDLSNLEESVNINLGSQAVLYKGFAYNIIPNETPPAVTTDEESDEKDLKVVETITPVDSHFEFTGTYDYEAPMPQIPVEVFGKSVVISEGYKEFTRQNIDAQLAQEGLNSESYNDILAYIDSQIAFTGAVDEGYLNELYGIREASANTQNELSEKEAREEAERRYQARLEYTTNLYYEGPWVEVVLDRQLVLLHNGSEELYTFLVSTGLPATATRAGEFRVYHKTTEQTMSGLRPSGEKYKIDNVKWNTFFDGDIGFHTAYWHNNFGEPMSLGCVNMREHEAKILFDFAPVGTRVVVH